MCLKIYYALYLRANCLELNTLVLFEDDRLLEIEKVWRDCWFSSHFLSVAPVE